MKLKLRPYQEAGRDGIRLEFRRGRKRPLYVLPTGGGKTVLYAAIAEGAAALGKRVLILEHRKELIRQASLAVGGVGVRHQVVVPEAKLAGIRRAHVDRLGWPMLEPGSHVAVASVQTVGVRMDWLAEFDPDLIVVDEAHHAVAGTWARILAACPRAKVLGVTATPCRTNGQGLGDVFDCMVLGPTMRELIAEGYLLPPRVIAPPVRADFSNLRKAANGDWHPDSVAEAMADRKITGDAVEHYARLAPGRPAIVFAANLKHAGEVAAAFREAGFRFEVIHGEMEDAERDRLIFGLADGSVQGLVTKDLISEGTDIPVAEVAIMLRFTESESLFLQQAGRVLRPVYAPGFDLSTLEGRLAAIAASGKPYGLVLDHVGNCGRVIDGAFVSKHGLPHADRAWSLEGRRRKKKGAVDEAAEVVMQCPCCFVALEPGMAEAAGRARALAEGRPPASARPECPACGFGWPMRAPAKGPEVVAGRLVEVSDAVVDEAAARAEARRAQAAARTQEALVATGMDPKRAAHVLAARAEKERLRSQLRELLRDWFVAAGRPQPAATACEQAFGFKSTGISTLKPAALRSAIEQVTTALLDLRLGPAENDGAFVVRSAG